MNLVALRWLVPAFLALAVPTYADEAAFVRGCTSKVSGENGERFCSCLAKRIDGSGLSGKSRRILRDFVALEDSGAEAPNYSAADKATADELTPLYSSIAQLCYTAATQGRLNADGSVAD